MLPREDLPLHLMFSLHNVYTETLQGDLTRGNFVTANRMPHSSRERGAFGVAWKGISVSPSALPVHSCCCFAQLQIRHCALGFLFSFFCSVSLGAQVQQIETSKLN